jgi:hypothetical protein
MVPIGSRAAGRRQAAACATVEEVLGAAAAAEALAVAYLGEALAAAAAGGPALDAEQVAAFAASRAADQAHYEYLIGAGAPAGPTQFTLPDPSVLADPAAIFAAVADLKGVTTAAYLAAAQELTTLGEPDLAGVAVQIGAVEAEHRALARFFAFAAGAVPDVPNDVAFAPARFAATPALLDALADLGWLGGAGPAIAYPGPGEIDPAGLVRLEP